MLTKEMVKELGSKMSAAIEQIQPTLEFLKKKHQLAGVRVSNSDDLGFELESLEDGNWYEWMPDVNDKESSNAVSNLEALADLIGEMEEEVR